MLLNRWYEAREEFGLVGFEMKFSENGSKRESQRIRWKVRSDEERETTAKMVGISLCWPFREYCHFILHTVNGRFLTCVMQISCAQNLWVFFLFALNCIWLGYYISCI